MPTRKQRKLDEQIMRAWSDAAEDLGIRVEIPFTLATEGGETERYEGRAIDFGGPNGIVFGSLEDDRASSNRRKNAGYCYSSLAVSYRTYNRGLFVDTLDDWKWFGEKGRNRHGIPERLGVSRTLPKTTTHSFRLGPKGMGAASV
jgi:hypothetical protein